MAFKVTTPMLHVLFASCQLWGTWNFYKMMKRQERLIEENEGNPDDIEGSPKKQEGLKKEEVKDFKGAALVASRGIDPEGLGSETDLMAQSKKTP